MKVEHIYRFTAAIPLWVDGQASIVDLANIIGCGPNHLATVFRRLGIADTSGGPAEALTPQAIINIYLLYHIGLLNHQLRSAIQRDSQEAPPE